MGEGSFLDVQFDSAVEAVTSAVIAVVVDDEERDIWRDLTLYGRAVKVEV